MELSQLYFDQLGNENKAEKEFVKKEITTELEVFQCQDCFTIYDETFGDVTQNIDRETVFNELPEDYKCSLCEASKETFKKVVLVK
jgi:rubredoxin